MEKLILFFNLKTTLTLGFLRILELCKNKEGIVGKIILDEKDAG